MSKELKFYKVEDCIMCQATGVIIVREDTGEDTEVLCPLCDGKGMLRKYV